jgi:hypothetical protein
MRTYHFTKDKNVKASQNNLVESAVEATKAQPHPFSPLLPEKFKRYLIEIYFPNFDPKAPNGLSRHTISHGVAPVEEYTLKGAIIGLLIADQLSFYLRGQERKA